MPSLILLSTTPAYPALRVVVAAVGAVLATGWLAERTGLLSRNPLEPVADLLVEHPIALALELAVVSLLAAGLHRLRTRRVVDTAPAPGPAPDRAADGIAVGTSS